MPRSSSRSVVGTSQSQVNPFGRYGIRVAKYPFSLISGGDPDDWHVAPPAGESQLHLWLRYGPDIDIVTQTLNKGIKILLDWEAKVFWSAPIGRPWIGSNVA